MTHLVFDHVAGTLSDLDQEVVRHVPPGGNWKDLPNDFPSARVKQIRESAARGEGSRSTYYGRLSWDRPAYTISTYINRPGNGAFIHPDLPRLLTVREAARLQSFPDGIRFSGTFRQRAKQVGNAVPPLLAYSVGRTIPAGTVVDLFSGAGGLGIGLSWAGHEVILSVDDNLDACLTATAAHGGSHMAFQGDLSDAKHHDEVAKRVKERLGGRKLGLLAGGPPCQGFSTAGPCLVDDPRNSLVLGFLQLVERLEPSNVLIENVVALRWRGKNLLAEVSERLSRMGYAVDVRVLHAEAYGVPQLRRRLFIRATDSSAGPNWPQPTHAMRRPFFGADQPGTHLVEPAPRTVADAIGDLVVPAVRSLDAAVEALLPESPFARWSRGEISVEELMGPIGNASIPASLSNRTAETTGVQGSLFGTM